MIIMFFHCVSYQRMTNAGAQNTSHTEAVTSCSHQGSITPLWLFFSWSLYMSTFTYTIYCALSPGCWFCIFMKMCNQHVKRKFILCCSSWYAVFCRLVCFIHIQTNSWNPTDQIMSTRQDGGGGGEGRGFFLSAHRCPEVDLVTHHNSEMQIPPPRSLVSSMKNLEFTCTGQSESNYLNMPPYCHCEDVDEEGSISEWSDEDLSLHFPPSVILPSDDEESDPECPFECIDTTMETLVSFVAFLKKLELTKWPAKCLTENNSPTTCPTSQTINSLTNQPAK